MTIVYVLVPISLLLGLSFVLLFVLAARRGQFDDCETPAYRMLSDADIGSDVGSKIKIDTVRCTTGEEE